MQLFTSEELQHRPAEVQQAALVEPALITFHGRPKLVMMSMEEFQRMQGGRHLLLESAHFSDDLMTELRQIAEQYPVPEEEMVLLGGLLEANTDRPPPSDPIG